jgi:glycosyltransferase involved in cell wall biosynthesis
MYARYGASASRYRVLMAIDLLPNGGAERQLTLLASHLPGDWDVHVASFGGGPWADLIVQAGVPLQVLSRRYRWDVRPALGLWRAIGEWQPHLVHTWGWMSTAAAILPCRVHQIPLVDGSIRNGMVLAYRGQVQRQFMRVADAVIANSPAGLEAYGVPEHRGYVVRNGFDPARWALCQVDGGQPAFDAVMVARMVRGKDFRCFLDAARLLRGQHSRTWKFAVVGSGDDEQNLRQEYDDLVEDGTVEFLDGRTEVLPHVKRAAIGVLLTDSRYWAEGVSNAIMEYMACGLPVVCSDSGGNRELVLDGVTGLVLVHNSPEAVAGAVRRLREDTGLAQSYGESGRRRIREEFSVESLVSGTLRVYARLVPAPSA